MAGKRGFYSDVIIYDERNRYYYLWAQKNKPLLDDEIRNMGVGLLDQVRRSVQQVYGEIASPYVEHSGFAVTTDSFKVKQSTDNIKNFKVVGGTSLDRPAVLYAKGYYIFLTEDIEYKHQRYTTSNTDLHTETDKSKTITPIPALTTPTQNRIDVVYVHLHFEEVSAVEGTDYEVYRDSNLKNPIVGTETAHRLRAVFDVRVKEGWSGTIDKNIFEHTDFLGGISGDDFDPTDTEFKIPIAAIYRTAGSPITDDQIVDLLSLYNKRVFSLEEITYRLKHGGYTAEDVAERGLTGFQPQFPSAIVDETAFATGLNRGLGTEALNSNSVTPRILDNSGKFFMEGLMVGHETGLITLETGPEQLNDGEIVAHEISSRSVYIGYGETGVTGMREYKDTLNVIHRGETGKAIASMTNFEGETGSLTMVVKSIQNGQVENFYTVDYKGRMGINTYSPGWEKPDALWNTDRYNDGLHGETGVNIALDVNASARVKDHLFVDKDLYVRRDFYGKTWRFPEIVSHETPAMIGFTGIPQQTGISDSVAAVIFKRGIAIHGETGIEAYGYTGGQLGYEAFDAYGNRLFTIGDLGEDFDRVVKSLYGVGVRQAFKSDQSFLALPDGYGEIQKDDTISYDVLLEDATHVTGSYVVTEDGWNGITGMVSDIMDDFPSDYQRTFQYDFHNTDGSVEIRTGHAYGIQVVEDEFGFSLTPPMDEHGRIVFKDMPEISVNVASIVSFTVSRVGNPNVSVTFTPYHYYGSTEYGGNFQNIKFAKLDLGEAADGWLFNGDVYFNGNGLLNRVTFSPNVVFRDDVFVYGTLYADTQIFNFANIHNLFIRNNMHVDRRGHFREGASFGPDASFDYDALRASDPELNLYVKGKGMMNELILRGLNDGTYRMGTLRFTNQKDKKVYSYIGGIPGDTDNPFGLHLVDDRNVSYASKFHDFTIDFSDGRGNFSDVSLVLKGDLSTTRYLQSQYLGVGPIDQINTDYRLQVNGRALINDVLEVKALRFIGSEAPEGVSDITDPQNITTIAEGKETYQNNQIILREKKFTTTKRIYLDNGNGLGVPDTYDAQEYYVYSVKTYYDNPSGSVPGRWAFDNISYLEDQFTEIAGDNTDSEIVIEDITIEEYKKIRCERIRVASLGTLIIEWSGYKFNPNTSDNCIQKYYFTSPYFRNRDGGVNIDWYPENERFGDDNFIINVSSNIIDTNAASPVIYSINKNLGIYIPKSKWWQYFTELGSGYRSFAIFYPYENITSSLNCIPFINQSTGEDSSWKLAIYPRLVKQRRVTVGTNLDRLYTGEWSLDVCIIPEAIGTVANLIGNAYIGYYQS